ncbi:acetolactate synthase, large subunit [Proteiniborus ethanoligenes]|uniref:Acetolactate synthase n=1 Tax=Proteiniborus ethanoligenes TaxID=415015 RepID=A0A1H3QGI5_9FIRM|nr:biosynthetic-type acetolactate synthase large subunit [Proteiniborus ethanoligenes]SDZ12125.1 acetolactate synthase, large subunit [Proteiniborus ethanoligenes]
MNGAKALLESLKECGVDTIFGYPGGAVIPLYDALYGDEHFKHIRTAHEQGAVHAADGYARSTGKVGVCFVTSGPGATNTVTGLATAYMDSVPLVVISGQVATTLLGKDSFQEVDIVGITLSVTKHNYLVRDVEKIPIIVKKAFEIAKSGRPGPVLIDIPKDIFLKQCYYEKNETVKEKYSELSFKNSDIDNIAQLINESRRPIIYAGGGVKTSHAENELLELAEKADIPVVNTLMSLGTTPRNHELSLGLVGMHGFKESNLAVVNCDLLLAIGARFSDRVIGDAAKFASKAKIVHLDIDSSEIHKNVNADLAVIGDIKNMLKAITESINVKDNGDWKKKIASWKREINNEDDFNPKNILESLYEKIGKEAFVATDVGQHQMWTAQYWRFNETNRFITSGGLGTMGFGLGAAIGAKVGNTDKPVLLVTGDGSFRMNSNELFTVAKYNVPLIILLMNNSALGMVRQWQRMFCEGRYSETDVDDCFDYVRLVNAYGIEGHSVNSLEGLNNVLSKVEFGKKPVFIECKILKDESVYPIVPPGQPIDTILLEG